MKRLLTIIFTLFSLVTFLKCGTMSTLTYHYIDGSNNQYIITPDTISYKPMTPELSSSGTYSGGEPKDKKISPELYEQISKAFQSAKAAKWEHIEKRQMGSGMVKAFTEGELEYKFLLAMRSNLKSQIETLLASAIDSAENQ
ncbi:MAG: hypothetical protein AAF502_05445 [Bacteroidota bacterium]